MAVSTRGTKSSKTRSRTTAARGGAKRNVAVRPRAHKWVYRFDEGSASMRDLLGGKGSGVAEMTRAGLPVPPGFTITTEACNAFYARGAKFPEGLEDGDRARPALDVALPLAQGLGPGLDRGERMGATVTSTGRHGMRVRAPRTTRDSPGP